MQLNFDDTPTPSAVEAVTAADVAKRVNASDKRMINATTDVNQLVPFKYKWAWNMYLESCNNHWMPQETNMALDAEQYGSDLLTDTERRYVERAIAAMANNKYGVGHIVLGIYRHLTAPEARQYLLRQAFEEALVPHVYSYNVEALGLNEDVLLNLRSGTAIDKVRENFLDEHLAPLTDPKFKPTTLENQRLLIKALVIYTVALKGLFSVTDFTRVLNLGLTNKLPGLVAQFRRMLNDQNTHVEFGIEVIQAILNENQDIMTAVFAEELRDLLRTATAHELAYSMHNQHAHTKDMATEQFGQLLKTLTNHLASRVGLGAIFPAQPPAFVWMAELLGITQRQKLATAPVVENKVSTTLDWE